MKSHLLASNNPCGFGQEVMAACGAIVKNPTAEMFSEVGFKGMPECNPLRDCKRCFVAVEQFAGTYFIYAIREGQEVMVEVE